MGPPFRGTSGAPRQVPELELDVRSVPAPKPKPRSVEVPQRPLELAVDPRTLVQERASLRSPILGAPLAGLASPAQIAFDGRLLADFGQPPRHPLLSPLYAYRVLRRRRALRPALADKRAAAARAREKVEEALLSFAERVRAAGEKADEYAQAFAELRDAEEVLRVREGELALDQVAQTARLSQVQSRISTLQADLAETQAIRVGVTAARTRVDEARAERTSLEHWFHRQSGARAAAVEEARDRVRRRMLAFAQRAVLDRGVMGAEFDAAREAVAQVELAAASAIRDAQVYEAALESHDASSVRRGMWVAALLLVVLVVAPVVWRAVRVVDPPVPRRMMGG
ncbi:MAG: hypothetical protein WBY94_05640 [Polyangiaceae bacterium]